MGAITIGLALCGLRVLVGMAALLRKSRSGWRIVVASCLAPIGLALLAASGYAWWYFHRAPPPALVRQLFAGVVHERVVTSSPRPLVINIVRVDLTNPDIALFVTPATPTGEKHQRARTATEFAIEFGVQVAVNANYFEPWSSGYWNYEPKPGGPVDVIGPAVSRGDAYGKAATGFSTLCFTKDKQARLGAPSPRTFSAVSGRPVLVRDGALVANSWPALAPRTAIGTTADSRELIVVTVDGRQPNYSEGMTIAELATFMHQRGAHHALNLDGGGSTSLVVQEPKGETWLLNTPIHRRVPPGQERPVANHFGVLVKAGPR